jgi:hypothetical protein
MSFKALLHATSSYEYLKSVLRSKFLILGTYHQHTPYLREQGRKDPRLFFEAKRVQKPKKKKKIGNTEVAE